MSWVIGGMMGIGSLTLMNGMFMAIRHATISKEAFTVGIDYTELMNISL